MNKMLTREEIYFGYAKAILNGSYKFLDIKTSIPIIDGYARTYQHSKPIPKEETTAELIEEVSKLALLMTDKHILLKQELGE